MFTPSVDSLRLSHLICLLDMLLDSHSMINEIMNTKLIELCSNNLYQFKGESTMHHVMTKKE